MHLPTTLHQDVDEVMQFIFTIVYVLEMLSICSVKGLWEYWGDPVHAFDGCVRA